MGEGGPRPRPLSPSAARAGRCVSSPQGSSPEHQPALSREQIRHCLWEPWGDGNSRNLGGQEWGLPRPFSRMS